MERSHHVFEEFLELCRNVTDNDTVVLKLLQQKYDQANRHFVWSDEFCKLIAMYTTRIRTDLTNKYVHIRDIVSELKAYKAKPMKQVMATSAKSSGSTDCPAAKRIKLESGDVKPKDQLALSTGLPPLLQMSSCCKLVPLSAISNNKTSEMLVEELEVRDVAIDEDSTDSFMQVAAPFDSRTADNEAKSVNDASTLLNKHKEKPCDVVGVKNLSEVAVKTMELKSDETTESDVMNGCSESVARCSSEKSSVGKQDVKHASHRQIRHLEILLLRYHAKIKKLEEKELSLEEMDKPDSSYLLIDRFKTRIMKIWNKLCKLKGQRPSSRCEFDEAVRFEGTRYPEVNNLVTRFINKYRVFPDYQDVHDIIERCNHSLKLKKNAVDMLAREAFTAVGNMLQKKRVKSFVTNFGCHLTDAVSMDGDPAVSNVELRSKLDENRKLGQSRLEELIRNFADRQDTEAPNSCHDDDDVTDSDNGNRTSGISSVITPTTGGDKVLQEESEAGTTTTAARGNLQEEPNIDKPSSSTSAKHSTDSDISSKAVTVLPPPVPAVSEELQSVNVPPGEADIVCIDDEMSTSQEGTPEAVTTCAADAAVATVATDLNSSVIDIADDDSEALTRPDNDRESDVSRTVKQSVVSAWQEQRNSALKTVVKQAAAKVSASHHTAAVSAASWSAVSTGDSTTRQHTRTSVASSTIASSRTADVTTLRLPLPQTVVPSTMPISVPTARVIGRIVSIRQPSPTATSVLRRPTPSVTHCMTAVSTSSAAQLTTAAVAGSSSAQAVASSRPLPAVTRVNTTQSQYTVPRQPGPASYQSVLSARRGGGVRRRIRPQRMALLRPEDLYEISSQIVAEVLQRNGRSTETDVITCDDDDEDDDGDNGSMIVLDDQPSLQAPLNDIEVIDDLPVSNSAPEAAGASRTVYSAHNTVSSARHAGYGAHSTASSTCRTGSRAYNTASSGSRARNTMSSAHKTVNTLQQDSHVSSAGGKRQSLVSTSGKSDMRRVDSSDDVRIIEKMSSIGEEADDVVCCDEEVSLMPASNALTQTSSSRRHSHTAAAAAAAARIVDDDVVLCDTPSLTDTRHVSSRAIEQDVVVIAPNTTVAETDSAVSDTLHPTAAAAANDDVVLVEADALTSAGQVGSQGRLPSFPNSSVIILD